MFGTNTQKRTFLSLSSSAYHAQQMQQDENDKKGVTQNDIRQKMPLKTGRKKWLHKMKKRSEDEKQHRQHRQIIQDKKNSQDVIRCKRRNLKDRTRQK